MTATPRDGALDTVRASWKRLAAVLALLALVPSWLGLLGGWHWLLDLFAHFRWQYLVVSAAVITWAAWDRRRGLVVLAALTFVLNAALIGRLAWHPEVSGKLAQDFNLRIVSFNVLMTNTNTQGALGYLLASDADVISLVEVDQKWVTALQPLLAKYPYHIEDPRPDCFGVALFSRVPLQQAGILRLGEPGFPSTEVRMHYQGRDFVIIGTHPMSPVGRRDAMLRDRQLRLLADHVSRLKVPALVVGDLNATPWSAGLRIVTRWGLGFRALSPPWTPTWSARSIFAIPIDQALGTAPFVITARSVGPDLGSDHRPLSVSVGWAR